VIFVTSWLGTAVIAQSQVPSDAEKVLASIRKIDSGQLSVSEEDGRFMRVLVIANGSKRALEIGSAYGYSAIWVGLGLRQTGGHLTTIDATPREAAADNIRRAGLSDTVTVVPDALKAPKVAGAFDCVSRRLKPTTKFSISFSHGWRRAGCSSRTTS
jgi:predicted O-methyltransferase YrrM